MDLARHREIDGLRHVCRLEEMNEARQSMVQRLKVVERERDGLEGARAAAEAYLDKERECTTALCTIYQVGGQGHILDSRSLQRLHL